MDFSTLVQVFETLEKESSGNKLREDLAVFFKEVPIDDLGMITYLVLGKLSADYESVVLGLAEKLVLKAIATAAGVSQKKATTMIQETGDVGLVAEKLLQKKPQTLVPVGKLTIHELFEQFHSLARMSGHGSQEKKALVLVQLFQKSSATGAKYIARLALGTLRLGVAEMTVLDALAIAFTGEKDKTLIEAAYNICPDVGVIATTLAKEGVSAVENIPIAVGRPIKVMLAQRVKQLDDVQKKMPGKVAVEAKYDGERVQAHFDGKKVHLFSRRMEDITSQFPDLVTYLKKQISAKNFILEAEILAIDEEGNHRPFQELMQRRRKYDVAEYIQKIPIQAQVFDLLYYNGKSVMEKPYEERTTLLRKIVKEGKHVVTSAQIITDSLDAVDDFFQDQVKEGYEGIMIKALHGPYQAGTRGWQWIKWKKDYVHDLSDSLDFVVIGAFHGRGRRSGTYGALLCATYDRKQDQFLTVCKLGTGLTDQVLAELPRKFSESQKQPARVVVKKEMIPDIWFSPEIVVEVRGAEITKSPFHSLGLALRFPRFIRFRDKTPEQATTKEEIEAMV